MLSLKSVLKNKDGKTVISNFGYLTILHIASYIFPLMTMPYLARVIGASGFGEIAFASSIIVYFTTITRWSFNYTATRDIAQNRDDIKKVSIIFSTILYAKLILLAVSYFILFVAITIVPILRDSWVILFITSLSMIGDILYPTWLFQGLEKMKYNTIFSFLVKAIFTILVFVFIKNQQDYILQPFFQSIGFLIVGIISLYIIILKWGIKLETVSLRTICKEIKSGFDVFVNAISHNLYNAFSIIILGQFYGKTANGIYDAGEKFVTLSYQFIDLLSQAFFPFLARRKDKHHIYARICIIVGILASVFLIFSAPLIMSIFFTEEFKDAVVILRILSVSLIFMVIGSVYGTNFLIIANKDRELRKITLSSSIIGFFCAVPMVFHFGAIGAATTVLVTRMVMGIWTCIKAKCIMK